MKNKGKTNGKHQKSTGKIALPGNQKNKAKGKYGTRYGRWRCEFGEPKVQSFQFWVVNASEFGRLVFMGANKQELGEIVFWVVLTPVGRTETSEPTVNRGGAFGLLNVRY